MLHTFDHLPLACSELEHTQNGDTIVLTANAIDELTTINSDHNWIKNLFQRFNLCVLYKDIEAKGLKINELLSGITILDDYDFSICQEDYNCIRSWN